MDEEPTPKEATLTRPDATEQREVMRHWRQAESGTEGPRGMEPDPPDDPVAYKLLDAAGDAIARGDWQRGVNILRLVVKDFRASQEAGLARSVLDRLAANEAGHGR